MLNAVDYALREIKANIPKEILDKTFINVPDRFRTVRNSISVDAIIKQKVIREIVLVDCNMMNASQVDIVIDPRWIESLGGGHIVIRIPKTHTQNRSITEVTDVNYLPLSGPLMPYGVLGTAQEIQGATRRLINRQLNPNLAGTVDCEVVGENTIAVRGIGTIPGRIYATVMVEHDDNLSGLKRTIYPLFGELCLLACKRYIWVNRIIPMDKAEIDGGYELNRFTSIIESYEDAGDEYKELLEEKWRKASIVADRARHHKYIKMITGLGLN